MPDDFKRAAISKATATSTALVAAVTGKRIAVYGIFLVAAGAVVATLEEDDGTDLTGPMTLATGTPVSPPMCDEIPILITRTGKALHLLLGTAVQVSGYVVYREIL